LSLSVCHCQGRIHASSPSSWITDNDGGGNIRRCLLPRLVHEPTSEDESDAAEAIRSRFLSRSHPPCSSQRPALCKRFINNIFHLDSLPITLHHHDSGSDSARLCAPSSSLQTMEQPRRPQPWPELPVPIQGGACHDQQASIPGANSLPLVSLIPHPLSLSKSLVARVSRSSLGRLLFLVRTHMVFAPHACIPYLRLNLSLDSRGICQIGSQTTTVL
jgi:hypothetical protein